MLNLKNKNNLFLILGVALVAVVLGSVVIASITGFAFFPVKKVKANSCDADSICEVAKTLSATRDLVISPSDDLIIQPGEATLINGFVRIVGPVEIKGDITTDYLDISSNLIKTKEGSDVNLILASGTGIVFVDGALTVSALSQDQNPLGSVGSIGYVCVNAEGRLIKSIEPCM